MRHANITRWVILVMALSCVCGYSFGQTPNKLSSPTAQPPAKRQGFFDYALGKINPHGNDYGASIDSVRNAAVENTIDDLYFWSNAVTLLLLSGLVAIVLFSGAPRTNARSSRPLLSHSYGTAASATGSKLSAGPNSSISWSKPITPRSSESSLKSKNLRKRRRTQPEA